MYKCPKCGYILNKEKYAFMQENNAFFCPGRIALKGKTRQCATRIENFKKDYSNDIEENYRTRV